MAGNTIGSNINYVNENPDNFVYSDLTPIFDDEKLSGYDRSYDVKAIKQSLINLFVVEKLEVPGKPSFGNPLNIKVFELFDNFVESTIQTVIRNLIRNYEPRVQVDDVRVQEAIELNRIIIEIDYFINLDNRVIGDTIYIPFAHNTRSFLDSRGTQYRKDK